ncbi:class C sortase [Hominifimenecus sp. rT4P-3]|uniref:class C sortase n=1 Tax=Hominifimenecus sp. rT4P-3 TaxID=3242979 RepID=UPI003DA23A23
MKQDSEKKEKQPKKKRSWISTVILVLILLLGIGIMAYPTVSDWWNSMHMTRAIANYVETVESMTPEEKEAMLEAARAYNRKLPLGTHFSLTDAELEEYESLLDLTGNGIMGYVQIPSISVNLPIYHTVEERVLQIAVGHIPGSSLPVGGLPSHAVMTGHRGLPSARLFTDLDKLTEGDIFTITVLDEVFTYMVDQIRIVEPEETDELGIVDGMDYCTLVTCTPYGVNSHRMLIRGFRIDNIVEAAPIQADAVKLPVYLVVPAIAIPMLFVLLFVLLLFYRRKPKHITLEDVHTLSQTQTDGTEESKKE